MKKLLFLLVIITVILPVYAQNSPDITSNMVEGYNPDYNILPLLLSLLMFYLITYILYDYNTIKKRVYRQIWSLILVGSFLFVGLSGIILSILADYNQVLPTNFNLLFWHVEAGIIMSISTVLHIHVYHKAILRLLRIK